MPATRNLKYPVQLVIMVAQPVGDLVNDLAEREGLYKAEVLRTLLNAGIRKAGYGAVLDTDKREKSIDALAPETGTAQSS